MAADALVELVRQIRFMLQMHLINLLGEPYSNKQPRQLWRRGDYEPIKWVIEWEVKTTVKEYYVFLFM